LGPYVSIVGWVGLGEEKWTHVHLCALRCVRRLTEARHSLPVHTG